MSPGTIELPLFPLNVVLFPGMVLPLHIFEPRYRLMIAECQKEDKLFGVVLARAESEHLREEPYPVGTTADIKNWMSLRMAAIISWPWACIVFVFSASIAKSPIFPAWLSNMKMFPSQSSS